MPKDPGETNPSRGPRPRDRGRPATEFEGQGSVFQPVPTDRSAGGDRPKRETAANRTKPDPTEDPVGGKTKVETGGPTWAERIFFGSVSSTHLATFCRQLSGYLSAGVDLIRSLKALEKQFRQTALGPVLKRVTDRVRQGDALSEAFASEPQAFDRLFLNMIRAAEARGGAPEVLRQMGEHYENRVRLFRKARSAMIYPTAVILIALAVGYLLTVFVLPGLVEILEDMTRNQDVALPGPTRLLMAISGFARTIGWWLVPLVAVGSVFGLWRLYRTEFGKAVLDAILLRLPILGQLMRKIDTTRFARTLSTLLEAGVDYESSMSLTAEVLHAAPFRKAVHRAREAVLEGAELSEALGAYRLFSVDVIETLSAGEETGKLPETLEHLADDYEEQVAHMVANLGQLIQPILTIGLGGIVLFIALAFVMAYISEIASLAGG